jgi:RNA polymerase sigma-70 factor (ECF subfamily)
VADATEKSDEALMLAYCAGDEEAFRQIFDRYAAPLMRTVRRHVGSNEDANEIVQQTFLHLHRSRRDFREGQLLRPWLFTICLNLRRDHFRRRGRRPEAPLDLDGRRDPAVDAYDPVRQERITEVKTAVEALPSAQREVIELHWFQGLPFQEVATIVGASETAVKVRAHRGYERLRLALGGDRNQSSSGGVQSDGDPE